MIFLSKYAQKLKFKNIFLFVVGMLYLILNEYEQFVSFNYLLAHFPPSIICVIMVKHMKETTSATNQIKHVVLVQSCPHLVTPMTKTVWPTEVIFQAVELDFESPIRFLYYTTFKYVVIENGHSQCVIKTGIEQ